MLVEERNLLEQRTEERVSIGITADGTRPGLIMVPWEQTAHAFNMRRPDIFISPEDLLDEQLMRKIQSFRVIGCYIFVALDDYTFISQFPNIEDIYIRHGEKLKDLTFLSNLSEWNMLHLEKAHLDNLEPIYESCSKRCYIRLFCLSFSECTIHDISALNRVRRIAELVVVGQDSAKERKRWKSVESFSFHYFTTGE